VIEPPEVQPRILVVGDVMLDHYLHGESQRISPEAPVPVVDIRSEQTLLGGAANVMHNLQALGARVDAIGIVGTDAAGEQLRTMLQGIGISTEGLFADGSRQTTTKTRVVVAGQQVVRFDRESATPVDAAVTERVLARLAALNPRPDAILISDYDKGLLTPEITQAVIRFGHAQAIPTLVDPKGKDFQKYRGATLVTPNRREATQLAGIAITDRASLERAGEKLRRDLDLPYALITLSEDGMALFGDTVTHIPAQAREVYDVTGAGDTVLATLGLAVGSGADMLQAAELANRAASLVVGRRGIAAVSREELFQPVAPRAESGEGKILSAAETQERIEHLRREGRRIVFTNGCFDLLHRGHVEYLQASRQCGDVLVVGVNSDASVARLKGPQRPVVAQEDRACMLAALAAVDFVVVFEQETPYELIQMLRPDVLTKGADYADREVVGSDLVGEVRLISLLDGRSTSRTIHHIRKAA